MVENVALARFLQTLQQDPQAWARIRGSSAYPEVNGRVFFYQTKWGVLVAADIAGLPRQKEHGIFAFHIHAGEQCTGDEADPFRDALTHYNPDGAPHPYHAGDLPPLFANDGYAFQVLLTDRFTAREIIHKTVVIHSDPDDFTSQPAGNAGQKIACGRIRAFGRQSL